MTKSGAPLQRFSSILEGSHMTNTSGITTVLSVNTHINRRYKYFAFSIIFFDKSTDFTSKP